LINIVTLDYYFFLFRLYILDMGFCQRNQSLPIFVKRRVSYLLVHHLQLSEIWVLRGRNAKKITVPYVNYFLHFDRLLSIL